MANEGTKKLDETVLKSALNAETNLIRKRVAKSKRISKTVWGFYQLILMKKLLWMKVGSANRTPLALEIRYYEKCSI